MFPRPEPAGVFIRFCLSSCFVLLSLWLAGQGFAPCNGLKPIDGRFFGTILTAPLHGRSSPRPSFSNMVPSCVYLFRHQPSLMRLHWIYIAKPLAGFAWPFIPHALDLPVSDNPPDSCMIEEAAPHTGAWPKPISQPQNYSFPSFTSFRWVGLSVVLSFNNFKKIRLFNNPIQRTLKRWLAI